MHQFLASVRLWDLTLGTILEDAIQVVVLPYE
jgi:hypothetical protein